MAKLPRITAKIFASNAAETDIGQYGSAKTGTKVLTSDVAEIQALPAYTEGWRAAVTSTRNYPTLQEMNGLQKTFSYQIKYGLDNGVAEYDPETTYYIGYIVKSLDAENKPILYYSLTDENLGNPLTDTTNWAVLEMGSGGGGGGLEPWDIGTALYIDESKGLRRWLNGQVINISLIPETSWAKLQSIKAVSPSLFTDEETWQAEATLSVYGQCGRFVIDEENGTLRLPKIVNLQGLQDLAQNGLTTAQAFPSHYHGMAHTHTRGTMDITGSFGFYCMGSGRSGAFSNGTNGTRHGASEGAASNPNAYNFKASNAWTGATSQPSNANTGSTGSGDIIQPESVRYPYFIQIATGQETEANIKNELTTINPYSLFESKYSEIPLNNLSWLKSTEQFNSGSVYDTAYQALLVENNSEVIAGTTVELPNGTPYVKKGLTNVKLSTETYDDYDFVLNTTDNTFRLPLETLFPESSVEGLELYFYVGETAQNIQEVNVGRINEVLPTKADLDLGNVTDEAKTLMAHSAMPSGRYINLTLGASGSKYTAPADGYIIVAFHKTSGTWNNVTCSIDVFAANGINTGFSTLQYMNTGTWLRAWAPVAKGSSFSVWYPTLTTEEITFHFIYAEGAY